MRVLIETYWNVKLHQVCNGSGLSASINRNILECKDGYTWYPSNLVAGINRNILECKV